VLELHDFNALKPNEPYYLAIFLVGAYQEVMGSFHNLFGLPNEAQIVIDADGRYHVTKLVPASKISDMLSFARYDKTQCVENFRRLLSSQINAGKLDASKASDAIQQYEAAVGGSTYLE